MNFKSIIDAISSSIIPLLFISIPVIGYIRGVKVYETFVEGAKEGFNVAIKIIPYLVAILSAIGIFRASGAMKIFTNIFSPITNLIGMPSEVFPLAIIRPMSGSGSIGLATELMKTHGPDSFIGELSSVMVGCTETTFYVLAVYFGYVGVKKARHAVAAGLIADAAGVLAALFICKLLFT